MKAILDDHDDVEWFETFQEVAEKTTEAEMELKSTRNSLRSLQEEHTQMKQELQTTQQEKTAAEESLKQLSEVNNRL